MPSSSSTSEISLVITYAVSPSLKSVEIIKALTATLSTKAVLSSLIGSVAANSIRTVLSVLNQVIVLCSIESLVTTSFNLTTLFINTEKSGAFATSPFLLTKSNVNV